MEASRLSSEAVQIANVVPSYEELHALYVAHCWSEQMTEVWLKRQWDCCDHVPFQ